MRGKDEALEQAQQANQTLREGLKQAIIAIESQQERVKTLEGPLAKDSLMQRASFARPHGSLEEELKQLWASKMKELLLEMKAEVERAKALGQQELDTLVLARRLSSL